MGADGPRLVWAVGRYIEIGQYDPARTNIKYCINQLRLKKVCVYVRVKAAGADGSLSFRRRRSGMLAR